MTNPAAESAFQFIPEVGEDSFDGLAFTGMTNQPEPDRIDAVADRIAALVRLQATPRGKRLIAVLLPDYPGAPGRTGYAVGLDVPASVNALLADLAEAGYVVSNVPRSSKALLDALSGGNDVSISIDVYQKQRRSGYDNDGGDTNPDPDDNFSHTLIVVAGFSPRSRGNPNAGFSPQLL